MLNRLVQENLRHNRPQVVSNAAGISFFVMALLMLAGTKHIPAPHPLPVQTVGWITVAAILWIVLIVTALFVLISRYAQTRERAREFAILKMLGASSGFIFDLLCQESLVVVTLGTIGGIALSFAGQHLIATVLPNIFFLRTAFEWWPLAALFSALGFQLSGFLAYVSVTEGDQIQLLLNGE